MGKIGLAVSLAAVFGVAIGSSFADDVRYYEQNGVTYRETRHTIQRPVWATRYEQREQTVYKPQVTTEYRDSYQTYQVPVTQYRWTSRWHGRWNPFVQPYTTQALVPVTHFEYRTEVVKVPVARTQWIPEKRMVQVPVTTQRIVSDEVVRRVAVSVAPRPRGAANGIGGVARLESDPPRQGTGWQAAKTGTTIRR